MNGMSVKVPEMEELLRPMPVARYGDDADGTVRGGALHLSALLPALSSAIGCPTPTAVHRDPTALQRAFGLPDVSSAVVVLVDGLGYWNLAMRLGHAPYLRSLMNDAANQRPICTCAPSTTVAAMGVFGTGTCPGLTGMAGYTQRNPVTGQLAQLIQFRDSIAPHDLQRQPTVFELLTERGVRVTSSGLPKFAASPLTEAALRGTQYISNVMPRDRVLAAAQAAREPGLTYLYIRDADKVGHAYGWNSDKWIGTFERIDAQLSLLRRSVPRGTLVVVTADHGMVSSDPGLCVDIAAQPELDEGVALVGGEPRSLMLYAKDDADPRDIAERWRNRLGEHAVVRTRRQAIDEGMFGPVDPRVEPMIGDVLVSAAGRLTVVDSRIQTAQAMQLPSVHGSQTALESDIPCLVDLA